MKRILIVDSDPKVCQVILKTLAVKAHAIFLAFDVVTAVSEARKHNPDLMIVDLSLPEGSGLVVVKRLRALPDFARMPIIMIAERGARLEAKRVFQAGANAFLPKPLNPHLLKDYVDRLLPAQPIQSVGFEAARTL